MKQSNTISAAPVSYPSPRCLGLETPVDCLASAGQALSAGALRAVAG